MAPVIKPKYLICFNEKASYNKPKIDNIITTIRGGKKASARVWEGSHGLEWTVDSPAPYHTFQTPPALS